MKKLIALIVFGCLLASCATLQRWKNQPLEPRPISDEVKAKREAFTKKNGEPTNPLFDRQRPIFK